MKVNSFKSIWCDCGPRARCVLKMYVVECGPRANVEDPWFRRRKEEVDGNWWMGVEWRRGWIAPPAKNAQVVFGAVFFFQSQKNQSNRSNQSEAAKAYDLPPIGRHDFPFLPFVLWFPLHSFPLHSFILGNYKKKKKLQKKKLLFLNSIFK